MMRKLGKQILEHLGASFGSAKYIKSLTDIDFSEFDRLLFTFSYVAHQDTVAPLDKIIWSSVIKRAVDEVDRPVELIFTTADLSGGALLDLKGMLIEAKILKKLSPIDVQVPRRFPDPDSSDGQICWDEQTHQWDVRAGHWTLSA